jgi:hypothetical protein
MPDVRYASAGARPSNPGGGLEALKLAVSWLWVGIPAVWGVYHVVVDALKLFR